MCNLITKGSFLLKNVKGRVIKPFSNRRADDNANDGGKGWMKILGLVVIGGVVFTVLGVGVAGVNSGVINLKGVMDGFKNLTVTP